MKIKMISRLQLSAGSFVATLLCALAAMAQTLSGPPSLVPGNPIFSGNVAINGAAPSTSPTTGALTVAGGLGVGGTLFAGGSITNSYWAPTNHQFGNANSSSGYYAGDLGQCGARNKLETVAPIECMVTDWLELRTYGLPVTPSFNLGGTWAAGDQVGIDAWLLGPGAAYTEYVVYYTVQAGDIHGGGNDATTYSNIVAKLIGTEQSGNSSGCIGGSGGYGVGTAPATPANCTGTNAFLVAMKAFPDGAPVAGGYRPQPTTSGAAGFLIDAPWGYAGYSATLSNVYKPYKVSSAGTLTATQVSLATVQQQIYTSGAGMTDAAPIMGMRAATSGRSPVVGDQGVRWFHLGQNTTDPNSGAFGYYLQTQTDGLAALASSGAGGTASLVLQAAPTGPPGLLSEFITAGNTWYVVDTTNVCAIPNGTTASVWTVGTLTITLSANINATAPCPGIASGDLISLVNLNDWHDRVAMGGVGASPTMFLEEGTVFGTKNNMCGLDPGYGNVRVCGNAAIGNGLTVTPASTATNNVKIGIWSVSSAYGVFSLNGSLSAPIGMFGGGSTDPTLYLSAGAAGGLNFYSGNNHPSGFTVSSAGAVAGTSLALGGATIGSNALAITGSAAFSAAITAPGLATSSAAATGTWCWTTGTGNTTIDTTLACLSSDERLKNVAGPFSGALAEVARLSPIVYQWKPGTPKFKADPGDHIGLGAFATAYADERLVARDDKGNPRGWREDAMIALLVKAVQEQQAEIQGQQAEIAALKARLH